MKNLYLNAELELSPDQQEKLFEGINEKINARVEYQIDNMDTHDIVNEVLGDIDASDLYHDMRCHIEDEFADRELLDSALDRIEKLEEALTGMCQALFKEFNPPDEPEESNA